MLDENVTACAKRKVNRFGNYYQPRFHKLESKADILEFNEARPIKLVTWNINGINAVISKS